MSHLIHSNQKQTRSADLIAKTSKKLHNRREIQKKMQDNQAEVIYFVFLIH